VFSFLRTLTTWHYSHSPAACCKLQQRVCCCGPMLDRRTDRRTDGRTPYRCIDPAPHTMRAVPIKCGPFFSLSTCIFYTEQKQSRSEQHTSHVAVNRNRRRVSDALWERVPETRGYLHPALTIAIDPRESC